MTQVFVNEIARLKKQILALSAHVEENVLLAVQSLSTRDELLARTIEESDTLIDAAEVEVEEAALKILALYQPVAMDLRFLTSVLKINNDLERIGDLASNIAHHARKMCNSPALTIPEEMHQLACQARNMVHDSLTAFVNLDEVLAEQVCAQDQVVDPLCRHLVCFIKKQTIDRPHQIDFYLHLFTASRNLERIVDHATNIAEDVLFLIRGVIVRHGFYE